MTTRSVEDLISSTASGSSIESATYSGDTVTNLELSSTDTDEAVVSHQSTILAIPTSYYDAVSTETLGEAGTTTALELSSAGTDGAMVSGHPWSTTQYPVSNDDAVSSQASQSTTDGITDPQLTSTILDQTVSHGPIWPTAAPTATPTAAPTAAPTIAITSDDPTAEFTEFMSSGRSSAVTASESPKNSHRTWTASTVSSTLTSEASETTLPSVTEFSSSTSHEPGYVSLTSSITMKILTRPSSPTPREINTETNHPPDSTSDSRFITSTESYQETPTPRLTVDNSGHTGIPKFI